jgi:hypothetical protein
MKVCSDMYFFWKHTHIACFLDVWTHESMHWHVLFLKAFWTFGPMKACIDMYCFWKHTHITCFLDVWTHESMHWHVLFLKTHSYCMLFGRLYPQKHAVTCIVFENTLILHAFWMLTCIVFENTLLLDAFWTFGPTKGCSDMYCFWKHTHIACFLDVWAHERMHWHVLFLKTHSYCMLFGRLDPRKHAVKCTVFENILHIFLDVWTYTLWWCKWKVKQSRRYIIRLFIIASIRCYIWPHNFLVYLFHNQRLWIND